MYRFKWPLCKKSAPLVLVWCYKARNDSEQDLWRYRLSEGCIKQWYDRRSCYGYLSKKYLLWEQWSSDIAVSYTLTQLSDIQSENTRFETYWLSPLTRIHIELADSSVLPLLFLKSLSIWSGGPIINTLWTGDADLHLYITAVQDGWRISVFLTRAWFPCTIHFNYAIPAAFLWMVVLTDV